MKSRRPNVLFLTVDALRADRTSLHGYGRPTTPNLDRLAANALVCDQAVSLAAFTQPSYPSLLTSSRPFSFGGYDHGAFGRPKTVFEAFHDAGYETHVLSTFQWVSRIAGYEKGIDHEIYLFVLNTLVGVASVILRNHIELFRDGKIDAGRLAAEAEPHLLRLFDAIGVYCQKLETGTSGEMAEFIHSRVVNDAYDYRRVRAIADRHRAAFLADKTAYVAQHFAKPFAAHEWLGREWRYARRWTKLAGQAAFALGNRVLGMVDPGLASLRHMRFKRYVDSGALADRVIRIMGEHRGDKPFFIWTHMIDTHVPYCPGRGRRWYRETPDYLDKLGHGRDHDVSVAVMGRPQTPRQWATWSALYDAAVLYVDEQIGRILEALDGLGFSDDTLVVVCGDHGEELGDHGDISHHFRLYSHNVRVPMMFAAPWLTAERTPALTTLADLVPTMAEICGVPPDPRWEGEDINRESVRRRTHVVLESFHGGSCDFARKPLYMAVRDGRYNYLWKEYRDPSDGFSAEGPELYDTLDDPGERQNVYRPDHPVVARFNAAIAERLSQIPEIAAERISTAFPMDREKTKETVVS